MTHPLFRSLVSCLHTPDLAATTRFYEDALVPCLELDRA